jgi:branched-chain amino acid transport system permease protein
LKLKSIGGWLLFIVALIAPVVITDSYHRHLMVLFGIFAILALSLDIIIGYLGDFPLGHAAFFGLGAYASALLALHVDLPFWLTLPLSGIFTGMVGLLVGFPSFRLRGPYFAIVTLGFAQIIHLVVTNWISLTRGPNGITKIPPPVLKIPLFPKIEFNTEFSYYYIILGLTLFSIFLTRRLIHCRTGRAILAIRENESLALSVGIHAYYFKLLAFSTGTMLAGMAGSAYAHYFRVITPDLVGLYYMGNMLIMVMVGGLGSISGAILGAFIFTILPEFLRVVEDFRLILFGAVLLVSIIYLPEGVSRGLETLLLRIFKANRSWR